MLHFINHFGKILGCRPYLCPSEASGLLPLLFWLLGVCACACVCLSTKDHIVSVNSNVILRARAHTHTMSMLFVTDWLSIDIWSASQFLLLWWSSTTETSVWVTERERERESKLIENDTFTRDQSIDLFCVCSKQPYKNNFFHPRVIYRYTRGVRRQLLKWTGVKEKGLVSRGGGGTPRRRQGKQEKSGGNASGLTIHSTQFQRVRGAKKEGAELYNDPWCTVQLWWEGEGRGVGSGVVVAFHPVPAVRLDLLQCGVHRSIQHGTGTHTSPPPPTPTPNRGLCSGFLRRHPAAGPSPPARGRHAGLRIAQDWQHGPGAVLGCGGGGDAEVLGSCYLCAMCAYLTVYPLGLWQKCTILPLFRESPFFSALN